MSRILDIVKKILTDVLTSVYEPFWFAVILAVLFMAVWNSAHKSGWKEVVLEWIGNFRRDQVFRRTFFLALYTALVLFRTLLNRTVWENPLSDVLGNWHIFRENGEFNAEPLENVLLFIPFILLLFWAESGKVLGEKKGFLSVAGRSIGIAACFSLGIESAQLLLRLGTFQLSDICYNTLGGLIGGGVYWAGNKVIESFREWKRIREEEENSDSWF